MEKDTLVLGGHEFTSRFILRFRKIFIGSDRRQSVENAGAQIITLALRRANVRVEPQIYWITFRRVSPLLPNTSGARNADEAVRIARLIPRDRMRGFCKD